jgi:hypothetical protein
MCVGDSSLFRHISQMGLSVNPISKSCSFRWQCPLSIPVTHHNWFLFNFNMSLVLTSYNLLPWRSRPYVHTKHLDIFVLHNVITQKTAHFIVIARITPNPTKEAQIRTELHSNICRQARERERECECVEGAGTTPCRRQSEQIRIIGSLHSVTNKLN